MQDRGHKSNYLLSIELTGASQLFLNPQPMFFFFFQVLDMESLVKINKKLANLVKFTLEKPIIPNFLV
jgi:hypothetical protein